MLKDIHLIEAALLTDRVVVSNDNKVRNHFNSVSTTVHHLKLISWLNPTNADEDVVRWLWEGAVEEDFRKIGYIPEKNPNENVNADSNQSVASEIN